ncbi:MAG: ribonuclease Z [Candidatus Micrarchaeota archaeon]|nr:ribonuclease Z [Candidatus Micrarchaeota archaeon]
MKIEIFFLGTGSGIPTPSRFHPSILINYLGERFMFDCGEGAQIRLFKIGVSPLKINRIFITHWHADHFSGLIPLIETMNLLDRKNPLYIYGPDAERFVEGIENLSYWSVGFDLKAVDVPYERRSRVFEEDRFVIRSVPAKHRVPAVAYVFEEKPRWKVDPEKVKKFGVPKESINLLKTRGRLKIDGKTVSIEDVAEKIEGRKIVYSGDTEPVREIFEEATGGLLIHEATFFADAAHAHSSAEDVARLSAEFGIEKLILTHFSRKYRRISQKVKKLKKIFPRVEAARDLMKFLY